MGTRSVDLLNSMVSNWMILGMCRTRGPRALGFVLLNQMMSQKVWIQIVVWTVAMGMVIVQRVSLYALGVQVLGIMLV